MSHWRFTMSMLKGRIFFALLAVLLPAMSGCTRHRKSERYYLIATSTNLPYWKTAAAGFLKAAADYGVTADVRGPTYFNPQAEVNEFRSAVASKPAGILVSVSSSKLLAPEIDAAIA